ncbi:hypothetical protein [Bermanella sp. R86510]|uniref:hypothetical protein n=1 Tax=unclassified Bermanella TaxID=2627862 RepID=UPI0037C9E166
MKYLNKNALWVSIAALTLTACGSSSDNDDTHSHDEDHDHEFSVLVSQSNTDTLSLLEEGELEALDTAAAGNGASLVLSENGAYAAVLANNTIKFVHGLHEDEHDEEHAEGEEHSEEEHAEEAHVLDFSLTGSNVISTNGHFAVLNGGSTTFVAYGELETITQASEDTSALPLTETYPALILDETHDLKLVFDGTNAKVFEGIEEELSFACANPSSHAQAHELVVISCSGGAVSLVVEEGETEHTFEHETLTLAGTAANYVWRAQGHVIAGFEPNTSNYAVIELDESGEAPVVEVVQGSDEGFFTYTDNICALELDSEAGDILTVTDGAQFIALNHAGEELKSIVLDESAESSCVDFVMAPAAKTALLIDNQAMLGYEIDVDEPETNPNGYHVHERFNLIANDIASMVIFHDKHGDEEHDDDHDH